MQAVREAIFGGCGYVPDVTSLQAWLECAWAAGYDPMGAEQLGGCPSRASCHPPLLRTFCNATCWSGGCCLASWRWQPC